MKSRNKYLRLPQKAIFIFTTAIVVVIAAVSWFTAGLIEKNLKKTSEIETAENLTKNISDEIANNLDEYADLLFITAHSTQVIMQSFSEHSELTERLYTEVMAEIPPFFQLRYIDSDGMEIHRVNNYNGNISVVPAAELQNKSDRYYFRDAVAQEPWSLYISPLDLNIENHEIEVPWIPTLRMATPVPETESGKSGIVIININLDEVLGIFNEQEDSRKRFFINNDGDYLAGAEKEKLWGFMFEKETGFDHDYPEAWEEIKKRDSGAIIISDKLYTHTSVDATKHLQVQTDFPHQSTDHNWKVVLVSDLNFSMMPAGIKGKLFVILVLAAGIVISRLWSRSIYEKNQVLLANEEATAALIKSEKMASLGRLVAGIAHELNTPIGASVTIVSTLMDAVAGFESEIEEGRIMKSTINDFISTLSSGTEAMFTSLSMASRLIANFKEVSVDQSNESRRVFKLPEYIDEILSTLKPTFKHRDISINIDSPQTIVLDSYPGAFAQVVSNIINNSVIHGFQGERSGIIDIICLKKQNHVILKIRDNGTGIRKEHLEKIFDPFFTTTSEIGGSGLGLHIVYNIVTDLLEGTLEVRSREGEYTEFVMELPLSLSKQTKTI